MTIKPCPILIRDLNPEIDFRNDKLSMWILINPIIWNLEKLSGDHGITLTWPNQNVTLVLSANLEYKLICHWNAVYN